MSDTSARIPATAVIGLQFGDEGKGQITDLLAQQHDIVVRYNGGANAGHSVRIGDKAYALLFKAMDDEDKIGIGRVVIRNKEYLAAIRPYGKRGLALETMYFPDEVVDIDTIPGVPDRAPRVGEKELKMARQLVGSLSGEWEPDHYRDTYREQVLDFIKKKAKGKTVEIEHHEEERPAVADLMDALRASVEGSRGKRKAASKSSRRRTSQRRTTPRRKSA